MAHGAVMELRVAKVYMERTFDWWGIVGHPPNIEATLTYAKGQAAKVFPGCPVVVLPYETRRQTIQRQGNRPALVRDTLPDWTIYAVVEGGPIVKDEECYGSDLVFIWFQDTCGVELPASAETVDWGEHARGRYL